jgi:RNA polymerase sigma-70 factor, ECF subfamily
MEEDNRNFFNSLEPDEWDEDVEKHWEEAVRNGDKVAFRNIFDTYYESLICFAFRYVKSKVDAEWAVQEVFLWIWEKRRDWNVEGTLKTYLFRAVKYKCLDLLRHEEVKAKYIREHTYRQEKSVPAQIEIEAEFDEEKFKRLAQAAIEELPERTRIIYKMSRQEGLTYHEIADVLEISPKTVESQMSRALNILRTRLSKYLGVLLIVRKLTDSLF